MTFIIDKADTLTVEYIIARSDATPLVEPTKISENVQLLSNFYLKNSILIKQWIDDGFFSPFYNIQKCFNYYFTCFILQQIFVLLLEFSEKTCIIFFIQGPGVIQYI